MPSASAAFAVRRRNAVSLVASAICHALIFGLGALLLTHSVGKPASAESVVVDIVQAEPDPIRDIAHAPPDKQPTPTTPATPRTSIARPRLKSQGQAQNTAPQLAVNPSTEVATSGDVALPTAAEPPPRKAESAPSAALPSASQAPAPSSHGPINVLATPRYRSNPRPDYPIASKRRHEEGEVRLTVAVSAEGRPIRVSLAQSSGHPLLDQAAMDAVHTWTFEPARASGVPVASQVVVPVRYSLSTE
jgi:protein TonB